MTDSQWSTISPWATGICWGLFALVWIVGAVRNARLGIATRQRSVGHRYVALAAVAVGWTLVDLMPAGFWRPVTLSAEWSRLAGLVVLASGTAFTLWARGALGAMWSSAVQIKGEHELRTDGPYAVTRHPIYTGLLAMIIGSVLMSDVGSGVVLVVLAVVWLEAKLRAEEQLLAGTFGSAYERYRVSVPRLVPGAHLLRRA